MRTLNARMSQEARRRQRRVDILFADAGSGHRTAATGLASALRAARPGWRVEPLDLLDLLGAQPRLAAHVRSGLDRFNRLLREDRIRYIEAAGTAISSVVVRGRMRPAAMSGFWPGDPPDAVVSLIPFFNPPVYQAARLVNPAVHCVTVPVEPIETTRDYWLTPGTDQEYLLATDALWEAATKRGIPAARMHRIGGMIIDPCFYDPPVLDVPQELAALGLEPGRPTVLVHFGQQGSELAKAADAALAGGRLRANAIFLAGRHRELMEYLQTHNTCYPKAVRPFEPDPPVRYLAMADAVVGKSAGMTMTEALVAGKPVVAVRSRSYAPTWWANEAWIERTGIGTVVRRPSELPAAIQQVLGDGSHRQNAARHAHRAVFEAADFLCGLFD